MKPKYLQGVKLVDCVVAQPKWTKPNTPQKCRKPNTTPKKLAISNSMPKTLLVKSQKMCKHILPPQPKPQLAHKLKEPLLQNRFLWKEAKPQGTPKSKVDVKTPYNTWNQHPK